MPCQVKFPVQNGAFSPDKEQGLPVVQQPDLIGRQKLPPGLLVVDAEAAASPFALPIGPGVQRFLAHKLRDVFVSFFLIAA